VLLCSNSLDETTRNAARTGKNNTTPVRPPPYNEPKSASVLATSTSPFYFANGATADSHLDHNELYTRASNKEFSLKNFAHEASLFNSNNSNSNTTKPLTTNKIKFKKKKLNKALSDPNPEHSENIILPESDLNDPDNYDNNKRQYEERQDENVEEKDELMYEMIAKIQSNRLDNQRCQLNQDYSVSLLIKSWINLCSLPNSKRRSLDVR